MCTHVTSLILRDHMPKGLEPLVYTVMCNTNSQICEKSANWSWPFNRLQQCIAGVNPSHVVRMETSSTLGPEDLDVSGSVEKGTNNARVRDYIHTRGKATHCRCQYLRPFPVLHIDRVSHARVRESFSVLFLVLVPRDFFSLNVAPYFHGSQLEPLMWGI